jgi:hypothetical protein
MASFKMGDVNVVDPISEKPLCIDGGYSNIQSRNNVFPLQIMIAKGTKESYKTFKSFFDFFALTSDKTINRDGTSHYWDTLDGFQETNLTATIDMSAQWKGLWKGGASKQSSFFAIVALLNQKMSIIQMKLYAHAFVLIDWMMTGFASTMK